MVGGLESFSTTFNFLPLLFKRGSIDAVSVGSRRNFEDMNRALDRVLLRPVIDRVYPWPGVADAVAHLRRGPFGKVVVSMPEEKS